MTATVILVHRADVVGFVYVAGSVLAPGDNTAAAPMPSNPIIEAASTWLPTLDRAAAGHIDEEIDPAPAGRRPARGGGGAHGRHAAPRHRRGPDTGVAAGPAATADDERFVPATSLVGQEHAIDGPAL